MHEKVLVIGYGSMGKRHSSNLIKLGIRPVVLTKYPDDNKEAIFINDISEARYADYAVIANSTNEHLSSFIQIAEKTNCKNVFIEKPIEVSVEKGMRIKELSEENSISVFIAYNMRYKKFFDIIGDIILNHRNDIRLVKLHSGQYLPEWRPYKDYRLSYSAHKDQGGGVHLDLSHEIDYMLWLFGEPRQTLFTYKDHISTLEIDSIDYFKGLYKYDNFVVDIELDYFRPKERYIKILGEDNVLCDCDLVNKRLIVNNEDISSDDFFDIDTHFEELKDFINRNPERRLCTVDEAVKVLELIK